MKRLNQWFKQPLRLRWKWTIILSLVFGLLMTILLAAYFHAVVYQYRQQFIADRNQNYQLMVESFQPEQQSFDATGLTTEEYTRQIVEPIDEKTYTHGLLQANEITIRLFDEENRLIYASKQLSLPSIESSEELIERQIDGEHYLVGRQKIPLSNDQSLTIEFIAKETPMIEFQRNQRQLMHRLWVGYFILVVIIAGLMVVYFLRPLHYLINTLDLVEEENIADIRVIEPKASDEWSDLSDHINFLLSKIDRYVRNQKQFVEDVSHELRTPVAIVQGHLQMLDRWGKDDPEILEESIAASLQEIERMKALVQEMLDLSRAEHADEDYHDEITEIYSTVEQVYHNFEMLYPEVQFYLDDDQQHEGELYVQIYRNHFEQLLIILLDNAVKYSTDRLEIHLAVSAGVNRVEIAVQDFGEGMSDEDKERVFSRFFRVDKARSRDKGGNGLGLSIAWQLVNSYKGKIRVESVEGHGSIFYIELPILNDPHKLRQLKEKQLQQQIRR